MVGAIGSIGAASTWLYTPPVGASARVTPAQAAAREQDAFVRSASPADPTYDLSFQSMLFAMLGINNIAEPQGYAPVAGQPMPDAAEANGQPLPQDRFESTGRQPAENRKNTPSRSNQTDAKGEPLSDEEQRQLDQLQQTDADVRAHEQAHKAAAGQYGGAISYDYQRGPDGQRYAVGGEVSIDVSAEQDPEATIAKMQQVRSAASAPADPSGQDRRVAATASRIEAQARQELANQRAQQANSSTGQNSATEDTTDTEGANSEQTAAAGGAPAQADETTPSTGSRYGITSGFQNLSAYRSVSYYPNVGSNLSIYA